MHPLEHLLDQTFEGAFSQYITKMQNHIQVVRQRAHYPHHKTILAMNSPFEWRPQTFDGQRGVLLIHGFLASPYLLRAIGTVYLKQGFLVRSILLPGHGTVPDELNQIDLSHWHRTVAYGIESLKREVKQLHLCGYSLGGTLSCLAAERYDLHALALISPAFAITPSAHLLPWVAPLSKRGLAMRYLKVDCMCQSQDDATYRRFPPHGALQVYRAVQALKRMDKTPLDKIPCFVTHSVEDTTAKVQPVLQYFKRNQHPHSWLRLYARDLHRYQGKRIEVIDTRHFGPHILDMSHIGIPVPPLDPYYGAQGHCYGDLPKQYYLGEYSSKNRRHTPFFRLTYNPDFWGLADRLTQFLNAVL